MRVALLTSGRFTLLDLGRELAALGHQVRFYSLVPRSRTRRFGLPSDCNRWLGPYAGLPYLFARGARGTRLHDFADHALLVAIDHAAMFRIEPCDVLVAMSGIGLRVLGEAKRRYGAHVFLERSSRHILSQREILRAVPGLADAVPDFAVSRELRGYALADVISVPSQQVVDSFVERGFDRSRLYLNPFGVDLVDFPVTLAPNNHPRVILFVGTWSLQKGVDVLVAAWRRLPATRLLHVGAIGDAPIPDDERFEHVDPVDQKQLSAFYARSDVCVLASRQEGLATVQLQALASGVRLVCTTRTGGEDLRALTVRGAIEVAPPDAPDALATAIARALHELPVPGTPRDLLGAHREQLSWRAYARRYADKMADVLRAE